MTIPATVEISHVIQATSTVFKVRMTDVLSPAAAGQSRAARAVAISCAAVMAKPTGATLRMIFAASPTEIDNAYGIAKRMAREGGLTLERIYQVQRIALRLAGANGPCPTSPGGASAVALTPGQHAELVRLNAKGWSENGLARRYGLTVDEVRALVSERYRWAA